VNAVDAVDAAQGHRPHAQARAVLEERAEAGGRPMHESSVEESRAAQWQWLPYMGEPAPMAEVRTRFVPAPCAEIPVTLYTPRGTGPFPALVMFHGGCWVVGNIDLGDRPHRALAEATGCVVVAVNYQKAPEHPFPVPLDDCYAAYSWTVEHAGELGVDRSRIGVCGDSAGGNLAAAVSLRARDVGGPVPAVQVLLYPAVDPDLETPSATDYAEGFGLSTADMRWSWDQYLQKDTDRDDPWACPARAASLTGLPPAVVVTAEFDVLRDEGRAYAERLRREGVPVSHHEYAGSIHGFLWMGGRVDDCRAMCDDVAADLRRLWVEGTLTPAG
jgi:acetyl esterase